MVLEGRHGIRALLFAAIVLAGASFPDVSLASESAKSAREGVAAADRSVVLEDDRGEPVVLEEEPEAVLDHAGVIPDVGVREGHTKFHGMDRT